MLVTFSQLSEGAKLSAGCADRRWQRWHRAGCRRRCQHLSAAVSTDRW